MLEDNIQIAFDATSAYVHKANSDKLNALGVMMIDLTPAAIGPYCVPPVNLQEHIGRREMNVNMVTCGGQANRVSIYLEVEGLVDYLPKYARQPGHHDRGGGAHRRDVRRRTSGRAHHADCVRVAIGGLGSCSVRFE